MKQLFRICVVIMLCLSLATIGFASSGYLVTEKEGMVAVWDCAADDWRCVTDTPVSSLPTEDRRALSPGVLCADETSLSALLEDYCS
ncbi:MAG: hypothetical protein VB055_00575 [Oscillospiraceae bacterium]|nr:hypothetical protein [Oscillospiraceae bacterium]